MESGRKSLSEVFTGDKFFSIPYYQRAYAWGDKQLKDFFEDFNTQYADNYYYGTVLLHELKEKKKGRYEYFDIVDGQQRLTTLIIFVSCIIKRMEELNYTTEDCDDLRRKFICTKDGNYILKIQSEDNDFFDTYILGDSNEPQIHNPSQSKLLNAKNKFNDLLHECKQERLDSFIEKIYSTNLLVYLIMSKIESAMIFETTNDRGKPLTNLEKTKSYLMYKACVLTEDADQLIDTIQSRFNAIYRSYTNIEHIFPNEESILQYSFIANSKWGNSKKYQKEYQHYMEIMKDKVDDYIMKNDACGLNKYINQYTLQIKDSFETFEVMMKNPCNELRDVQVLGNIANFYPLLLKTFALDLTTNKSHFKEICHLCEIFSFRTYVIMKYFASKAQTTIYTMARDFNGNFDELKSKFIGLIIREEFNDNKFIEKLCSKNFYKDYDTIERNYFYWKYENYLRLNEQPIGTLMTHDDLTQKENKKLKLTAEHIVAQNNEKEKMRIITKDLCVQVGRQSLFEKEYLHTIGNLTLDPQSANSSKGNNDVSVKMSKYFVKSQYKSQLELQDFLDKGNKWTINSILKRRDKLLEFAKKTWCDFKQFGNIKPQNNIIIEDNRENYDNN